MREVRVQALHAIVGSSAHPAGALELMEPIASRDVILVRCAEPRGELFVGVQPFVELLHTSGRLETSDRFRRAHARQPVQGRERILVDDRKRLDHRRKAARTSVRDADVAAQRTSELTFDRSAVLRAQSSFWRMFRLMSA
jgi:hypothetical protein